MTKNVKKTVDTIGQNFVLFCLAFPVFWVLVTLILLACISLR